MLRFTSVLAALLIPITLLAAPHRQSSCGSSEGQVEREVYYSGLLQAQMYYSVYLPPCYAADERLFPVLYLMHGSNEDDGHWLRLGLKGTLDRKIRDHELPPMIVVLPFGNVIANRNRFDAASWGNIFLTELIPIAEERYRIDPHRETRAIGGISRGGFWAYQIAFRHPEMFSAVGGHSAFFDRYHAPPEENPLDLALNAPGIEGLRLWLDRGEQDFAQPGLDIMAERLNERGLAYTYAVHPQGEHNNIYWSQHLAEYLEFYTADWPIPDVPESAPRNPGAGLDLFVPVVSFPSLQASLSLQRLQAVARGQADPKLVLNEPTAAALRAHGLLLSAELRVVPPDMLFNLLWRDRTLYTLLPFDQLIPRYRVLHIDEQHPVDLDLEKYPFAFASDNPSYHPDRLTRVLLSGVTALTRGTREALDEHGIEWAGEAIRSYTSQADFFHISNEVSIYPGCPQTDGELLGGSNSFCSKPEHFALLPFIGVDIVELTGNHNNDYGFLAYGDTLRFYQENQIVTLGGGPTLKEARQPYSIDHHGNSVAMLACNWIGPYYALADDTKGQPGAAYCDLDWLAETLPQLAQAHDLVIVTVQYQEFEQYTPTDQQARDFGRLAQLGADVVIGTQAHKPQTFEFFNPGRDSGEAFIHYGLGNLFFDQEFWGNMRFFMDELFIYEGRLLTVNLFTGLIEERGRPRPMTPDERQNFLHFMFVQQNGF